MATTEELLESIGGLAPTKPAEAAETVASASYEREQVYEAARNDLDFLAALAIPLVFRFAFPPVLKTAWSLMVQATGKVRDFTQLALGIPRGHAKTTVIKLFILFCILFTSRKFILVISATASLAENILADVVDMLDEPNIKAVFGDWRLGIEKDTQNIKKFTFRGRNIILAAIGAEGSLRGLNLKNERPDVMLFEDVQTRECADSQVQSETLERWMVGTAMKAKSPMGCLFIFIGNMYPTKYSILKKLKENPRWIKFINGAILADGTALWPEQQPLEQLLGELENDIAMGHPEIFLAEVLNDDTAGVQTRVDVSRVQDCHYSAEHSEMAQGKFIVIDPATDKNGADPVTITQFYVFDATPVAIEIKESQLSPGETIKEALKMAFRHNCRVICVESNAYQYSLLYWFDHISKQLGIAGMHFCELYSGTKSKNGRIADMIKQLNVGEILLAKEVRSLVLHQIFSWNPMKRDNVDGILDTLTYAPKAIELYGPLMETATTIINADYETAAVHSTADTCTF